MHEYSIKRMTSACHNSVGVITFALQSIRAQKVSGSIPDYDSIFANFILIFPTHEFQYF